MRILRPLSCGIVSLLLASTSPVLSQGTSASTTPSITLQAELVKALDANHAKAGDEVTVRTVMPLQINGKNVPAGSTVSGHVTKAEPNLLVVVFDQITVKKEPPAGVSLSLRAVMMPNSAAPSTAQQMSPSAQAAHSGALLRSPEAAAQDSLVSVFDSSQHPVTAGNGGVIGLSGVKLLVSSDPKVGSAFQSDAGHKLKLDKGLQLMFVVSN